MLRVILSRVPYTKTSFVNKCEKYQSIDRYIDDFIFEITWNSKIISLIHREQIIGPLPYVLFRPKI